MKLFTEVSMFIVDRSQNLRKELRSFMPGLNALAASLKQASVMDDKLSAIVFFFDAVSPFHDGQTELTALIGKFEKANFRGQYDQVLKDLFALRLHFRKAGRSQSGLNRTSTSQQVTDEDVYLGEDRYGLRTHNVKKLEGLQTGTERRLRPLWRQHGEF